MADFLARLAGRTLGSTPTVQPIITPMFTPKQAWIGENDPGAVPEDEGLGESVQQQPIPPIQETQPPFYQPVRLPPTLVAQGNVPTAGAFIQQSIPPIQETQPPFYQPIRLPPTLITQGNVPALGAPVMSSRLPFSKTHESQNKQTQQEVPNSPEQSEPESSPVPGTLTSSDEQRSTCSTDKSPVEAGTNKRQSYTNPLPLLQRMPTRQPSRPSLNASEGVDHAQGMLLPGDLDPFSEQARGIEINPEHFQSTSGQRRRSMRASHEDGQPEIPNALQPGASEMQSALPTRAISPDQRSAQQRAIRPQVSTNRAYHGGSHHNTSSPVGKHEAVGTQFIVPDPAPSTIQVTIGRIEVRATPPPPSQSQGKRSPSSVMSLDQYLHQRAKGGDR